MNVLLVGNYPSEANGVFTGPMRVVANLAKALSDLDGVSVTVLTPHRIRHLFRSQETLRSSHPRVVRTTYLSSLTHRGGFDVVNVHGVSLFNTLALSRSTNRKRTKIVFTAHGLIPMERELGYRYPRWMASCEKRLICSSDAITTVSEETKQYILAAYDVPAEKITVIGNGVDVEVFHPDGNRKPERSNGRVEALFVGDLLPAKGLDFLLAALGRIDDSRLVVRLVGTRTVYFDALAREHRSLFEEGKVGYAGRMGQEALTEAYRRADFCVFPSRYDQYPQVVLEALSMGKPVVLSDRVGTRRIVEDGVDGYVVPFGRTDLLAGKIVTLTQDRGLRERMGRRARQKAEQNTWAHIAEEYRDVFASRVIS